MCFAVFVYEFLCVRCDFFKGCLIGFKMSIFQNRDQEASANASAIVHHLSHSQGGDAQEGSQYIKIAVSYGKRPFQHWQCDLWRDTIKTDVAHVTIGPNWFCRFHFNSVSVFCHQLIRVALFPTPWLSDWAIICIFCIFFSSCFSDVEAVLSSLNHKQQKPVAGPEMPLAPKSSVSQIPSKSPGNQRSRTLKHNDRKVFD